MTVVCVVIVLVCELSAHRALALQLRRAAALGINACADVGEDCVIRQAPCDSAEIALRDCALRIRDWQRQNYWENTCYRELPLVGLAELPPAGARLTGPQRAAISLFMSDNDEVIDRLCQLAASNAMEGGGTAPAARLSDRVLDNPDLERRALIAGLGVAVLFAADQHDAARARVCMKAMFELHRTFPMDHLITEASRLAATRLTIKVMQSAVAMCAFGADELQELQKAAGSAPRCYETRQTVLNVLSARCRAAFAAQRELRSGAWADRNAFAITYILTPGWARYDVARAVGRCVADAEGIALGPRDALRWYRLREASAAPRDWRTPVTNAMDVLQVAPALERLLETVALCRAAEAGLAAVRYRTVHGGYPEALPDLVPAFLEGVPEDPFDGQPLRYACERARARVWSVGAKGADDRGLCDGATALAFELVDQQFPAEPEGSKRRQPDDGGAGGRLDEPGP